MTNLDAVLKSRDISLPTKVCVIKAMVFPVVMYGYESWTIKKAERWRTDVFWTVVLEKTLESSLDSKEIKPVIPKGNQCWIFTGKDRCWSSNNLAIWYEEPTHQKKTDAGQRLKAGGVGDDRGWDGCMASPTQWTWVWANSRRWWRTGKPGMLQSIGPQTVRHDWPDNNMLKVPCEMPM